VHAVAARRERARQADAGGLRPAERFTSGDDARREEHGIDVEGDRERHAASRLPFGCFGFELRHARTQRVDLVELRLDLANARLPPSEDVRPQRLASSNPQNFRQ
jgi:hypothetical protein